MEDKIDFKCISDHLEEIPAYITEETGLSFPMAHTKGTYMAVLAKALKADKQDVVCRVPFCNTVEAENFGALIKLGDSKTGPRVKDFRYQSIEELAEIPALDITKGRLAEVLEAIQILSEQGERVVVNLEGPFTIISSLIDLTKFYKALRKNKEVVERILAVIEEGLLVYAKAAMDRGAAVISYADQVGTLKLTGPKIFRDVSAPAAVRLVKGMQAAAQGRCLIHLCGLLSTDLENLGLCSSKQEEYDPALTYGEGLQAVLDRCGDCPVLGHACIKKTTVHTRNHAVTQLILP